MEIAISASVTVSMAAEMKGMPSLMLGVSHAETSTMSGVTSEYSGTSRTSSNVSALPSTVAIFASSSD